MLTSILLGARLVNAAVAAEEDQAPFTPLQLVLRSGSRQRADREHICQTYSRLRANAPSRWAKVEGALVAAMPVGGGNADAVCRYRARQRATDATAMIGAIAGCRCADKRAGEGDGRRSALTSYLPVARGKMSEETCHVDLTTLENKQKENTNENYEQARIIE